MPAAAFMFVGAALSEVVEPELPLSPLEPGRLEPPVGSETPAEEPSVTDALGPTSSPPTTTVVDLPTLTTKDSSVEDAL